MTPSLDALSIEMFRTFARFEYSLKHSGFHMGNGEAQPNWHAFALSIPDLFVDPQDPQLKDAVQYILDQPPKKQMIEGNVLAWRVSSPQTDLSDKVLIYVRRVRNNLFHGGKFNGHWFEPERSELLLRHSLTILNACVASSTTLGQAFHG